MKTISPFNYNKIILNDNIYLYTINIEKIDDSLKKYLDKKLIKICKGNRAIKLATVKKEFISYLERKKVSNLLTGSVAEFFVHLFLTKKKFKQEFLYFNLEEGSIKKGFDGYYSKNEEEWVVESKSSKIPKKTNHSIKINEAYVGLKNKIEGSDNINNPWENAYNHAGNISVNSKKTILDKLNILSEDYTNEKYRTVNEFNIIPCSTIFMEDDWEEINTKELTKKITIFLSDKVFKKIILICINKKSLNSLKQYLES